MTRPEPGTLISGSEQFAVTEVAAPSTGAATDPVVTDESGTRGGAGDYQLGALLGRGGMGEVVLAHDPKIGRDVALKRMRGGSPSDDATARFLREAKIQARLDHPAIVPVHEVGRDADGRPYFTMKRLAGTTLAARLADGKTTQKELLRALIDVCHAIELAHARGVVHRDLKPANIMLGDYGEVYVLDWGVARVIAGTDDGMRESIDSLGAPDDATATQAGALLGTPGYMPPEQARGEDVGTPADIYALGATLYEVLAGVALHSHGAAAIASTLEPGPRSPAARAPERGVAPELDALCVAALADAPAARPTARAFADALQRYLDGDRDLEQRRALAAAQLAVARAALASGDPARRGDAVHAAGRALALDPGALEAAALVTSLIVEPPAHLPAELQSALDADEVDEQRRRSRRAIFPFLSFFALTPFLPWLEIRSWPTLIGVYAAVAGMIAIATISWRFARVPTGLFLTAHFLLALMFTRVLGPFVLTPTLICGALLAISSIPWLTDRPWAILLWTAVTVMAPFGLEWLGWFAPTFHFGDDGLTSSGTIVGAQTHANAAIAIAANASIVLVVAGYAWSIARDRRAAKRATFVQAWHLKHLLPRTRPEPP